MTNEFYTLREIERATKIEGPGLGESGSRNPHVVPWLRKVNITRGNPLVD